MDLKTTGVLLALLIVGLAVWSFTPAQRSESIKEPNQPQTRYVLDPRPAPGDVTRIEIQRSDGRKLSFARKQTADAGSEWEMLEPVRSDVEGFMVDTLVSTFTGLVSDTRHEQGLTDADAGLDAPVLRVLLEEVGGRKSQLRVGRRALMGGGTYVRTEADKTIHSVARDIAQDAARDVNDYRSKTLVSLAPTDVSRVEIRQGESATVLERGADSWRVVAPVSSRADGEKLTALITRASSLRVVKFIADAPSEADLAGYGLAQPVSSLTLVAQPTADPAASQPAPPTSTVLLIGAHADIQSQHRFVKRADQPWVATVAAPMADGLAPKLDDLRDLRVLGIAPGAATRIELIEPDRTSTLLRTDGRWQGDEDLAELDSEAVSDLVRGLEDLRAAAFIDEPAALPVYGLGEPQRQIRIQTGAEGNVSTVALLIGDATEGGNRYVKLADQPGVMVISAAQARRILVEPLSLRSPQMFDLAPERISRIDMRRGEAQFAMQRDADGWRLTSPAAPADPASLRELTNDLARLRGKRVVGRRDDPAFGLDQPAIDIEFTTASAATATAAADLLPELPETHRVIVSQREARVFAARDDDPYAYELDVTVLRVFLQELIDRRVLSVDAEQVIGIRVDAPGGSVEFARDDAGVWAFASDPTVRLAQAKVQELVTLLAQLRCESYLAYSEGDVAAAGLAEAPAQVRVTLRDAEPITLALDQVTRGDLPRKAAWLEGGRIFLMRTGDVDRLMRGLDQYVAPENPALEPPPGAAPGVTPEP